MVQLIYLSVCSMQVNDITVQPTNTMGNWKSLLIYFSPYRYISLNTNSFPSHPLKYISPNLPFLPVITSVPSDLLYCHLMPTLLHKAPNWALCIHLPYLPPLLPTVDPEYKSDHVILLKNTPMTFIIF